MQSRRRAVSRGTPARADAIQTSLIVPGCAAALVVAFEGPMGWLPNRLPVVVAWL